MSFKGWIKGYLEAVIGMATLVIGVIILLVSLVTGSIPTAFVGIFLIALGGFAYLHGKYQAEANSPKGVYRIK